MSLERPLTTPLLLEKAGDKAAQPTTVNLASTIGQQFLRFHLLPDTTALLPVNHLVEVLTIPIGQIVPIPHMPAAVMGIYNWRGEILWMVDLGQLIGLPPLHQQASSTSTYAVIVIHEHSTTLSRQHRGTQSRRKMLGLVVHQVEDIERCDPDLIQSPAAAMLTPALVPFLRGHWLNPEGEIQLVLEAGSILAGVQNSRSF